MTEQKATNIAWHRGSVSCDDRAKRNGHKGAVLWFTGLSASGKSTLAFGVEKALFERGCHAYVLDGDNVRHGLNKDLGFSPKDRTENIRRIGEVAHLFADAGVLAMTAFISPYIGDRNIARMLNPPGQFFEIYCECPIEVCEKRDPKGLYKKARAGQLKEFTGIDAPYEPPEKPELVVHTGVAGIEQCVANVIRHLEEKGVLASRR